jgi:hypothetical protein
MGMSSCQYFSMQCMEGWEADILSCFSSASLSVLRPLGTVVPSSPLMVHS